MSFFGTGARAAPSGQPDQARLAEAAMELEAVSDLFNRIVSSCHAKCISPRYAEPELNKGEGVCVDRCVAKYFAVNEKVQERLQNAQKAGQGMGM
ncbi:inner membrane translocase subunit [Leucosporidium creatinivorum]|uniref:Mitochondrial import inner membrane translocase subunit n=1 Tax=Leucosporidium creatinivorum TaxID=106004 RepID=A0A1Y2E455_9BASI|nr:inner membrane translocase subunit [Leucosporidium creatinivorum]